MASVVVFPRCLNGGAALAVLVLRQDAVCEGRAALQSKAELAPVAEPVDNVVAVDRALDERCQFWLTKNLRTQARVWNLRSSWHNMKTC